MSYDLMVFSKRKSKRQKKDVSNNHTSYTYKGLKSTISKTYICANIIMGVICVLLYAFFFLLISAPLKKWGALGFSAAFFSIIWLYSFKTITILHGGLEIKRTLLPFIKQFYRFSEFDFSQTKKSKYDENFQLIRNGKRIINISSSTYSNYEVLKKTIPVRDKKHYSFAQKTLVSSYKKLRLWGYASMYGIPMLSLIYACFIVNNPVVVDLAFIFLSATLGLYLLEYLSRYKKIIIYNGQIKVRRLLWPFKVNVYRLSDIDGHYRVSVNNGIWDDEEAWWLVKDNKLILSISYFVYKNYDELTHATKYKSLGTLHLSAYKSIWYRIFKKTIIYE